MSGKHTERDVEESHLPLESAWRDFQPAKTGNAGIASTRWLDDRLDPRREQATSPDNRWLFTVALRSNQLRL